MRRDVFIQDDSGALSVVAGDAVAEIIDDNRSDDLRLVTTFKALLLELRGDDSMPVRIVVDEPLRPDEDAQWLARASWRLDTTDGRVLVMGGFDPDVLDEWRDESGGEGDGRGVVLARTKPGSVRVDVYALVARIVPAGELQHFRHPERESAARMAAPERRAGFLATWRSQRNGRSCCWRSRCSEHGTLHSGR